MQQDVQTDATCNIPQCWELLANSTASVKSSQGDLQETDNTKDALTCEKRNTRDVRPSRKTKEYYEQGKVTHIFRSVQSKAMGNVDSVLFYSYVLDCNVCCCQRFRCEAADLGDQL